MPSHSRFIILFAFIIVAIGPSKNAEATVISQCNPYDRSCVCERGALPCMPDCIRLPSYPRCGLSFQSEPVTAGPEEALLSKSINAGG